MVADARRRLSGEGARENADHTLYLFGGRGWAYLGRAGLVRQRRSVGGAAARLSEHLAHRAGFYEETRHVLVYRVARRTPVNRLLWSPARSGPELVIKAAELVLTMTTPHSASRSRCTTGA